MDQDDALIMIYTTVAEEQDARKIGRSLIQDELAACVNILPGVVSIYRWQGAVQEGGEIAIIVKTRHSLKDSTLEAIKALHPYEVPALIVFHPASVSADYKDWAFSETKRDNL